MPKLAVLQADHTDQDIAQEVCDVQDLYHQFFGALDFKLTFYDLHKYQYPSDPYEYDACIITGSRYSVYEPKPWMEPLKKFISSNEHKKLLGICFGAQIIAYAFGGTVEKSPYGWHIGVHGIDIVNLQSWMKPEYSRINMIASHQDVITKLPDNAKLIAKSETCPNQIFAIADNIVGFQCHPEFNESYQKAIMYKNAQCISENILKQAERSYAVGPHREVLSGWVLRLLQNS